MGRPEEPARLRPPLLRVLPSRDAERAARVRRDRAHDRHRRPSCRRCSTRARPTRPRAGRHRGLLFDLELPARARGREPRHRAHQAGRRGAAPRPAAAAPVRDAVADPRLPRAGSSASCGDGDASARARARAAARRAGARARPARRRRVGRRRGDPARARSRCAPATSRPRATAASIDPVANFHLANGAAIERINWLADPSPSGRRALGRAHGELPVRARPHRRPRRGVRDARRGRDARARSRSCSPSRFAARGEARLPRVGPAVARPGATSARSSSTTSRRGCSRAARTRARRCDLDDDDAQIPTMVPGPRRRAAGARVRVDLARRARHRAPSTRRSSPRPASGAPATSSPSRCTATTATTSTRRRATGPTASARPASSR